jgi:hypothetical protein
VTTKGRPEKGETAECPKCHRWVGYWPDKLDYHVAHLMRHRSREHGRYDVMRSAWCDGTQYVG